MPASRPKPIVRSSSGLDAEAAFLRERLRVLGRIGGGLSVVFYVVVVLLGGASWWTSPQGVGVLIVAGAFATLGWIGPTASASRMRAHETAVILVATLGCGVHGWLGEGAADIRYDAVLALGQILVVRAVLIPSTWKRTAILGGVAALPVVLPSLSADRLTVGLFVGWGIVAVAVSALISHVVHDLRERVTEARRLGRYILEAKIGEGGMGEVYRARHAMLRRPTAIKLLRADRAGEAAIARFESEVQRTAELTHPNTVSVYDYGRTDDGVFYYAMELLPGLDLSQLVRGWGPMPTARAAHVLVQVCGSLHEAHLAGLVHRDVKAANVVLTRRGGRADVAKVLDFGLVRGVDDVDGADVDHVVGTPAYLSPEGLSSPETVDARADLYAVGVLAYLLLAGRLPFEGESLPGLIHQHLFEAPPPLPASVPTDVVALVMSCLEKDADDRPDSAAEIAKALATHAAEWTDELAAAWWADVPAPSTGETFDGSTTVDLARRLAPAADEG